MNEYKVILYKYGKIINETNFTDLESARRFYYKHDSSEYGLRLYVNGKKLKIHEAESILGRNPYWSYTINR